MMYPSSVVGQIRSSEVLAESVEPWIDADVNMLLMDSLMQVLSCQVVVESHPR